MWSTIEQIVPTHHYLRLLASIGIEPQEVENHELAVENLQRGAKKSRGRESSCSTPSTGGNDEPPAMENQPIMDPLTTSHSSNSRRSSTRRSSVATSGGTTSTPRRKTTPGDQPPPVQTPDSLQTFSHSSVGSSRVSAARRPPLDSTFARLLPPGPPTSGVTARPPLFALATHSRSSSDSQQYSVLCLATEACSRPSA